MDGFTHDGEFVLVAEDGANDLKNYPVKCVNGRIWVNNHAHVLQGKARIADNSFLAFAISQSDIESLLVGGGRAKLNAETLMSIEFRLPCLQEQYRIGEYLSQLDDLITLHQRQPFLHSTSEISLTVQLIHPFYTSSWEQRKLGDVLDDMYNGQTPSRNKSQYWNGNIKWLSSGELNRGTVYDSIETITEDGQKSANLRIVPKGTFIMAITGLEAVGTRGNCALLGFDTTLNQSCMALFPKKDLLTSDFLFQWYGKVGEEYGLNYTQGTKQQSYNAELIKILPISLPSVAEQKKIASYLNNLDHLITLHQRKGKAAVTGCSNDANNSNGVYCKTRDFGYKCYKEVKSQQIRCLIAVFIFCV